MKYKCNDCDTVFDESEARVDTTFNQWGIRCVEIDTCPKCHSENLEEDYKEDVEDIADDDQSGYGDWMRDLFQDR